VCIFFRRHPRTATLAVTFEDARQAVGEKRSSFPRAYYVLWSGQFELSGSGRRHGFKIVVAGSRSSSSFLLLFLNFRAAHREHLIVMLSLPFCRGRRHLADCGGSASTWSVRRCGRLHRARPAWPRRPASLMLIYLDQADAPEACRRSGAARRRAIPPGAILYDAIMLGAVDRVRPKMMTVGRDQWQACCPSCGATGAGSEVMQRNRRPR